MACLFSCPPPCCPNFAQGAAGSQAQVLQKDVLPSPPASPLAKQPLSAGEGMKCGRLRAAQEECAFPDASRSSKAILAKLLMH